MSIKVESTQEKLNLNEMMKNTASELKLSDDKAAKTPVLKLRNVDVGYETKKGLIEIVKNVTFDVNEGEIFGLIGESGSGKTTLSRALMKIHNYQQGSVEFYGKELKNLKSRDDYKKFVQDVQMVFQDPYSTFNPKLSINKIVGEGLDNFKLYTSKEERKNKIVTALKSVGSGQEFYDRYPHEFSGGQRQRIAIARALVMNPKLIIADEPVSALDVSIQAQILNLLQDLIRKNNMSMLFVAHDLSVVKFLCDRVAIMHKGQIVEYGNTKEVFSNPQHPYTKNLINAIPHADPKAEKEKNNVIIDFEFDNSKTYDYIKISDDHFVINDGNVTTKN